MKSKRLILALLVLIVIVGLSMFFFMTTSQSGVIATGSCIVVDLSSGAISHLDKLPSDLLTNGEYKTTKMVLKNIKAGTFIMGSPTDERGRNDSNETQHMVTLTKDFYIGVFEVTQKQYETIMGNNPSSYARNRHPVESVSWDDVRGGTWPSGAPDALSFMGKLRALTGPSNKFDLPTEAQWEYACRAGTTKAYNNNTDCQVILSGQDTNLDPLAWYGHNTRKSKIVLWLLSSRLGSLTLRFVNLTGHREVGTKQANTWGLYDMHGNVCEWCLDWYQSDLGNLAAIDPEGSSSGSERVLRGESWYFFANYCRSANRRHTIPLNTTNTLGFRLAMTTDLKRKTSGRMRE